MDDNITHYWQTVNRIIEEDILAKHDERFLQNPTLKQHTVVGYEKRKVTHQLSFLKAYFGLEELKRILNDEPEFGAPDLYDFGKGLVCSPNSMQMLYHIGYWGNLTNGNLRNINSVLEWGGGYGAMARIVLKINPEIEYFMIDTPTFSELQSFYLIYGLRLPTVYIHNINQLEELVEIPADLFISTWALSESPRSMIEYAASFPPIKNVKHVLLAYQQTQPEFEAAGEVVDILNAQRVNPITQIEPVSYSVGADWYATC